MVLLALPPADHLPIEEEIAANSCLARRRRMMANVRAECLVKIPAGPSPELRIPGAAAQTRVLSKPTIRPDSGKSVQSFKAIICDDISEFESHMPSPKLRIPNAAAQTRVVSMAGIRLDPGNPRELSKG